jgi:hypothetical protein
MSKNITNERKCTLGFKVTDDGAMNIVVENWQRGG